jgi:hypothetical protein
MKTYKEMRLSILQRLSLCLFASDKLRNPERMFMKFDAEGFD